jgi:iron complex transport system ATP-binding protein
MTTLSVRGLQVELDRKTIVSNIDLELGVGQWICIIGPNGAGKSSLLKALAGIIPSTGEIRIDDANMRDLSERDRACWIAHRGTGTNHARRYAVFDYVLLGRTAHLKMLATESRRI